jgi:hypothetical protein
MSDGRANRILNAVVMSDIANSLAASEPVLEAAE